MDCLSLNSRHGRSISFGPETRQRPARILRGFCCLLAALPFAALPVPAMGGPAACTEALGTPVFTAGPLATVGTTPVTSNLALAPGRTYLIEVQEHDNDALVEVLDSSGHTIARADHPERRSGTRRAIVTAPESDTLMVRITGKEQANAKGSATVLAFDLDSVLSSQCLTVFKSLAMADAKYAVGQEISSGRVPAEGRSARDAYLRALEGYTAAERALTSMGDRHLRGETELALTALYFFDLKDWSTAETWAKTALATLGAIDAYRHARAEALLAYVWIQVGQAQSVRQAAALLDEARALLEEVRRFHIRRAEEHDAALQVIYISLTYLYQGRYAECITSSAVAGRLFGSLHELARVAQAEQNRALCLWGLGRLSEARDWFERSLGEMNTRGVQGLYIGILYNTALLDYAVNDYDDSLRLYDRARGIAEETQQDLDAARILYGLGVNYRALGAPDIARGYLEQSLAIRSVAKDGRGRMDTLRALAAIDAEEPEGPERQGRLKEALKFDSEALSLAVDPLASESIRVQLADHTAVAGRPDEGKALLDDVLARGPHGDPIIVAQALVKRAVILRGMERYSEAVADLELAQLRFHALARPTDEFTADLELARALRAAGRSSEALRAVKAALLLDDAVRLQSANPALRAQLQEPLRAAYDLEIELLRGDYEEELAAGHERQAAVLAAEAFTAADSSRARSFADVAAQRYSPTLRRELAPELRKREEIYRQLAERRFALADLIDVSSATNPRARHLLNDIAELQRQADTVNTAIAKRALGAEGESGGRRSAIPVIPPGTALISFWIGSGSSYAWVVLPGGEVKWARLSRPKAIADRAIEFHDSLTRFVDLDVEKRLAAGGRLSELVLQPIEPWLSDVRQWIVVPDGALDYVPFVALPEFADPRSFVVLRHQIALTPAAWMLGTAEPARHVAAQRGLLLVADPVYEAEDPRLPQPAGAPPTQIQPPAAEAAGYRRLTHAAQEVTAIRREFPPSDVDELTGLDATRDRFLASDVSRYRFIHVAVHGRVDTSVPELSALVLGSYDAHGNRVDGTVRVSDLALQTLHADVAVFSACDTALGKQVASEGLVGISSTVLARGARAVVGSLWPVSDEIGAELMTEFYRHLLRDSMSAPAALAVAMRSIESQPRDSDPALWAAFRVSVVAIDSERTNRSDRPNTSTTSAKGGAL
jgi:CHAT domain-containing protein/tetratricopeptide (TPR) repeat protein